MAAVTGGQTGQSSWQLFASLANQQATNQLRNYAKGFESSGRGGEAKGKAVADHNSNNSSRFPSVYRMQLCDLLQGWIEGLPALPLEQVAFLAAVTLVTAGILYLLLDAWRYRAIPDLDVSLTDGEK